MRSIACWPVWALPSRLLGALLVVEAFTLILLATDSVAATQPGRAGFLTVAALITAGVYAGAGLVHAEVSHRIERLRSRVVHGGGNADIDLGSVWTFAAAITLPPLAACLVALVNLTYLRLRIRRGSMAQPLFKEVFTGATVVLAIHAAAATVGYVGAGVADPLRSWVGVFLVVAGMLAFTAVNTCLVVGVVVISSNKTVREIVGHGDEVVLEIATLCLGGLVAVAVAMQPWLVVFALPPLLILHRAVLVRQLEKAANTDGKTGLLTAAAWHDKASQQLEQARVDGSSAGVLVIDLDHFKRVNDDYGHLAGDVVLQSVAAVLREDVRGNDLVGRFGGEEFVMLFPRPDTGRYDYGELRKVAERIRRNIAELHVEIQTPDGPMTVGGVTVSIGGAVFPQDGGQLLDVVAAADSALYAAKRAGRDRVRMGPHPSAVVPADGPSPVPPLVPVSPDQPLR